MKLVDKPTVRNEWYEAVKTVWGYEAGRNGAVVKWLTGKESETEFNKYPIQPPMSPTELLEWSKDYKSLHEFMIEKPYKVQESIIKWRRYKTEKPAQEAAAAKHRADIEAAQRISTMIATGNYDALDETEAAS